MFRKGVVTSESTVQDNEPVVDSQESPRLKVPVSHLLFRRRFSPGRLNVKEGGTVPDPMHAGSSPLRIRRRCQLELAMS